jgi:hypothetical protein
MYAQSLLFLSPYDPKFKMGFNKVDAHLTKKEVKPEAQLT